MRHIFLTDAGGAGLGIKIEITLRQAQSVLLDMHGHQIAPAFILGDGDFKEGIHPHGPQGKAHADDVLQSVDGGDQVQFGLQRGQAQGIRPGLIHGGGPKVPDLLRVASRRRRGGGGGFVDFA